MFGVQKFFVCEHCGNFVGLIYDGQVPMICCGEKMKEVEPNTVEASAEKHLPVVTVNGEDVNVKIGSAAHPMSEDHYIQWVYVETERGGQRKGFKPGETPELNFKVVDDKPVAVFAYCNLHGLWKTQL